MMTKLPILALGLALAGCISLTPKPPSFLLTLSPAAPIAVGQVQRTPGTSAMTIAIPSVPQELGTLRLPVRSSPTTVAYLQDARWVEPINRQFARLLSDTLTTRAGRAIVSDRQLGTDVQTSLTGELRTFGVDATAGAVVVTFDAALIRTGGAPLEKRRFEARVPVAEVTPGPVGTALNQAANQVAGEVADWVGK
jgi:cholesterol transport system auxiliary component